MSLPYGKSAFPTEGDANGSGVVASPGSRSADGGRPLWKALQMRDVHGLHQYALRSLQPPQFQRQSQQRWQPGVVQLSFNTPVFS